MFLVNCWVLLPNFANLPTKYMKIVFIEFLPLPKINAFINKWPVFRKFENNCYLQKVKLCPTIRGTQFMRQRIVGMWDKRKKVYMSIYFWFWSECVTCMILCNFYVTRILQIINYYLPPSLFDVSRGQRTHTARDKNGFSRGGKYHHFFWTSCFIFFFISSF